MTVISEHETQKKSRLETLISGDTIKKHEEKTIWDKIYSLPEPSNEGLVKLKKQSRKFLDTLLDLLFGPSKEACVYCRSLNPAYYTLCQKCSMPIDGGDTDKIIFSKDFWDYLDDLKYLPSLDDRNRVAKRPEDKDFGNRDKIWDYFFRINPDDLGQPQKYCIDLLEEYMATLSAIAEEIKKEGGEIRQRYIRQRDENISKLRNLLYRLQPSVQHLDDIRVNKNNLNGIRQQVEKVIQYLRTLITHLQIEASNIKPPLDSDIKKWLEKDLEQQKKSAHDRMAIDNLLVTEYKPNPLIFESPGQLQDLEKIPRQYQPFPTRATDEYISLLRVVPIPDKAKHLLARQIVSNQETMEKNENPSRNSSEQNDNQVVDEIIFAVHYIEHIGIGEHLLAQNSFFYDFVSGQVVPVCL